MRVTLVYPGTENLGIQYLSAVLKAQGHSTTQVLDPILFRADGLEHGWLGRLCDCGATVRQEILDSAPDLVGFYSTSETYPWARALARWHRQARPAVPQIIGGPHASAAPAQVMQEQAFDALCVGEGELALLDYVVALEQRACRPIPNLWIRRGERIERGAVRPLIGDLDELPFPDKQPLYDRLPGSEREYVTLASRGCLYQCTFCCHSLYKQLYAGERATYLRRRSVRNLIAELVAARAEWRIRSVYFHDDIFPTNLRWLEQFAREYRRQVALPYSCFVYPSIVNERIAELLADSGCVYVTLGVQTFDPQVRKEVFGRPERNDQIAGAIRRLTRRGIQVVADHIFGTPQEQPGAYRDALLRYAEVRPTYIQTFWLTYYANFPILELGLEAGGIDPAQAREIQSGEGGARSFFRASSESRGEFRQMRFAMNLYPLLPPRLFRALARHRLYRLLPPANSILLLLPRLLAAPFRRDYKVFVQLHKYVLVLRYFLLPGWWAALRGRRPAAARGEPQRPVREARPAAIPPATREAG